MAVTRRSFLRRALASSIAVQGVSVGIARDLFAKPSGQPIIIGHQCDLTGGFSSWGYWCDKAARPAVDYLNERNGIAATPGCAWRPRRSPRS
jgi:branched-chain amino acid transport system substrate-binding protein